MLQISEIMCQLMFKTLVKHFNAQLHTFENMSTTYRHVTEPQSEEQCPSFPLGRYNA